ncbi:30S ribosomal protein S4 [Candidatus Woesearchaeota archaeon]|nr:30S ribosomal protein S4 [Candidatus Woesearchaeota archaeon]
MGDPRRIKKKYPKPAHLWQKARIEEERVLMNEYGLESKSEIWKANSLMRGFADQAKRLIASKTVQAEKEKVLLLQKLVSAGIIRTSNLDSVLDVKVKDVLDRRLQTVVFRKGLARSIKQARQMIVHGHVSVAERKITSPSYLVKVADESAIGFVEGSGFASPDHPERVVVEVKK